jgi:hypothetical protein
MWYEIFQVFAALTILFCSMVGFILFIIVMLIYEIGMWIQEKIDKFIKWIKGGNKND